MQRQFQEQEEEPSQVLQRQYQQLTYCIEVGLLSELWTFLSRPSLSWVLLLWLVSSLLTRVESLGRWVIRGIGIKVWKKDDREACCSKWEEGHCHGDSRSRKGEFKIFRSFRREGRAPRPVFPPFYLSLHSNFPDSHFSSSTVPVNLLYFSLILVFSLVPYNSKSTTQIKEQPSPNDINL